MLKKEVKIFASFSIFKYITNIFFIRFDENNSN